MPTPERTSVEEIVAVGLEILDASGPVGLTMQAVADRVGVRPPSLYKRIRDKDALHTAVAVASIDQLTARLETAGDDLTRLAHAYREFAREHPQRFRMMFTTAAPEQALHRSSAPVIRCAEAIVGPDDALDAARLFTAWATGFLQMELAGSFRLDSDLDRSFEYGLRRIIAGLAV